MKKTIFVFILLSLSLTSLAQTESTTARKNLQAYCMGPKLDYEAYSRQVVEGIQAKNENKSF